MPHPKIDSLETVEMVMLLEDFFAVNIPDRSVEEFGSFREIVDYLESALAGKSPDKEAAAFLKKLAKAQDRPELIAKPGRDLAPRPDCRNYPRD